MMPTVPIVGCKPSATQPFENKGNAGVPIVPRVIRAHGRIYKGFFFEWGLKTFPTRGQKTSGTIGTPANAYKSIIYYAESLVKPSAVLGKENNSVIFVLFV